MSAVPGTQGIFSSLEPVVNREDSVDPAMILILLLALFTQSPDPTQFAALKPEHSLS